MALTKLPLAAGATLAVLLCAGLVQLHSQAATNQALERQLSSLAHADSDAPSVAARNALLRQEVAALRADADPSTPSAPGPAGAASARLPSPGRRYANLSEALAAAPMFEPGNLDTQPVPIDQLRPNYPKEARIQGKTGTVTVDFVVGPDGNVFGAHAIGASDAPFADSAVNAVSQWLFKPGLRAGVPVNTHLRVPIVYTLGP